MPDKHIADHGLTPLQQKIIKEILQPFANQIDKVGLFGSRATGLYRNNSDIDMVIYGDLKEDDVNRLWTLFDSSPLPIKVDIQAYSLITYPPLKKHIDEVMKPLFIKNDLI
jgi:predicted nucleotidyltransferase